MTVQTKPLEVELYVCQDPGCRLVGKVPLGRGSPSFRGMCSGSAAEPHKRLAMKPVLFREVTDAAA